MTKNLQITEPAISLELRQTNLEELVKNKNELIEKLTKKVNTIEGHKIFLKGKLAGKKKADDLEVYTRRPCLVVSGVKKEKK